MGLPLLAFLARLLIFLRKIGLPPRKLCDETDAPVVTFHRPFGPAV